MGAVLIANGLNPWVSTVLAGCAGFAAGALTASLHVRFQIIPILSGILVAVALYSINLRIMGGPNKPLLGSETVFDAPARWLSQPSYITNVAVLIGVVLLIKVALDLMFKTGFGFALRATGSNAEMARGHVDPATAQASYREVHPDATEFQDDEVLENSTVVVDSCSFS